MMNFGKLLALLLLGGCGLVTERSIYEGMRSIHNTKQSSTDPNSKQLPPYDQYKRERDEIRH